MKTMKTIGVLVHAAILLWMLAALEGCASERWPGWAKSAYSRQTEGGGANK